MLRPKEDCLFYFVAIFYQAKEAYEIKEEVITW